MKKIFIFLLAFLFALSLKAQTPQDSIIVKNTILGHSYSIDSNKVSRHEIRDILIAYPSTNKLIRASGGKKIFGGVCMTGALAATAYLYMEALANKKDFGHYPVDHTFYYSAVLTAGVWVLGIVSVSEGNWKFQRAIKIYNKKAPQSLHSSVQSSELNFNVGLNYLSLTYRF